LLGILAFGLLQLAPPPYDISAPPADPRASVAADPEVPPPVLKVLKRACMDCHSHETRVPWYGRVAPSSWMLAKDVTEARQAMNLSQWGAKSAAVHLALSAAACEGVRSGRMPRKQYLLMHPEAKLSSSDVETICGWQKAAMTAMLKNKHANAAND
jgi:hypothetical protein